MAERRMFTKKIVESDAFLDMPLSTQALYFHLNMGADDDGFVNNPKRIQRTIGASEDDLKLLVAKRFVLSFENGVVIVKHWLMNNTIRKDRYNASQYHELLSSLCIKENGAYTELDENDNGNHLATTWQPNGNHLATTWQPNGNHLATTWQPDDNQRLPQVSIGKVSIDKDNKDIGFKESLPKKDLSNTKKDIHVSGKPDRTKKFVPPTVEEVKAYCKERNNSINAENFVDFYSAKGWLIGKNKMKDWKACVRTWERNKGQQTKQEPEMSDINRRIIEMVEGKKYDD